MFLYRVIDKRNPGFGDTIVFADSDARMIREISLVRAKDQFSLWRCYGHDYELYRVGKVDPLVLQLVDTETPILIGSLDKFDVPPSGDGLPHEESK